MTKEEKTRLRGILTKGKYTVYTTLHHVSKSGMTRVISCKVATKAGEILTLDWFLQDLGLGKLSSKHDGLTVSGAGMDMGHHIVYGLSRALYSSDKLSQRWL
ncbi:MAG: hypothetical protein DRN81_04465 [Thermoproteota archaeon]|nr:MAG: hypothetical protein DRN81_04465 [Candidatus Korarchaeota archaeon]